MQRRRRSLAITLVLGLVTSLAVAAPVASASGAAPSSSAVAGKEQVLFRSGTSGYGCFRIPVLARTASGSLLAFAEARKSPSCGDRGDIDLVLRRSTNDGRTWGPIRVVLAGTATDPDAPFTRGNAAPVVDQSTGRIFLISTSNEASLSGKRLPWIQQSDDDGLSWTPAKALGATFDGTNNGWFATGPAHGIQLRSGRLVVGAHQKPNGGTVKAGVLYSDTHGETWQASEAPNSYVAGKMSPGEISVAELPDGSVYASARNEITAADHRAMAVSTDGGTTMPAFTAVPSLVTPSVQGGVLALRSTYQSTPGDTLIFSGPSDPSDRKLLKIRYSTDNGNTWTSPAKGLITNERSGYSDLAELTGGEIGVLYEGGVSFSADEIRFNRFTPAEIGLPGTRTGKVSTQLSPAAGATSPDTSPEANDAYLAGNATLSNPVGQGLVLDGTGDYADVPYARTIDPGAGDFTYSTRFKYSATASSPNQVIFWGYGVGVGNPQLWLRAQPAQDQLFGWVQGTGGGATIAVKDLTATAAFGDNTWHHLSLVRSGGQLRLTVDGTGTTATGVTGSVTSGPDSGLRLGAKQDATASDPFTGSINDFRFYRRALSTAELGNPPGTDPALGVRLPFQVIDGAATPGRVKVAITDDLSAHCADGTLLGGYQSLVNGRVAGSEAVRVNATHPGVEVPFTPTLDLGAGDFTFAAWFQYSATASSPNQALLWAFGSTAGKRSVWVRAQPSLDRLYAWVQTDTGQVAVPLPDPSGVTAFGDGAWHLLALTRTGGQVQLSVDGGTPATATGLTGSVTAGQADILGLRLGSKPGDTDILQGDLDDFRLYDRALAATELSSAASGAFPADMPSVWWPFESGFTGTHEIVRLSDGPSTPGASAHCNNAYVRGGAGLTAGRVGSAMAFDGTDDAVQIPYGSATALGTADFTISTWLKYSATGTTGDQVILWAHGVGATERALWLRAQPSKDRLYAYLQTDTGPAMVTGSDTSAAFAFGDGAWHHLALQRSAGVLSLIVDGKSLGRSILAAGALTYDDNFSVDGFQLGAKPDGTDRLAGALDEFRIFRKALSTTELNDVRQNNTDLGPVTSIRLPFDVVSATGYARM